MLQFVLLFKGSSAKTLKTRKKRKESKEKEERKSSATKPPPLRKKSGKSIKSGNDDVIETSNHSEDSSIKLVFINYYIEENNYIFEYTAFYVLLKNCLYMSNSAWI